MLAFLKELFWTEEKPNRREFFYMVLLLSSLISLPMLFTASYSIIQPMIGQLGAESLAAFSIYSTMAMSSRLPGFPWHFLVLIGSFFLVRRVFGKELHLVWKILGAVVVYYFFVSPQTMAYSWLGKDLFLGGDIFLLDTLKIPVLALRFSSICNFLVGGIILLIAFLRLEAPSSWGMENPFELNRIDYLYQNFYLGLIALLFGGLILGVTLVFQWDPDEPLFLGLTGALSLGVTIRSITLMVRRMRHSRFSAHWLWGLLFIWILLASPAWIYLGVVNNLLPAIAIQRLVGWGLRLLEIMAILLLLAPAAADISQPAPEMSQPAGSGGPDSPAP